MQKIKMSRQEIKFFSDKNQKMLTVHSADAKKFADTLENDSSVLSYEPCIPLDPAKLITVNMIGIRTGFRTKPSDTEPTWETDFVVEFASGKKAVRELSKEELLEKRAELEKLEMSRRYWKSQGITDWKIVLLKKKEDVT